MVARLKPHKFVAPVEKCLRHQIDGVSDWQIPPVQRDLPNSLEQALCSLLPLVLTLMRAESISRKRESPKMRSVSLGSIVTSRKNR